MNADVLGDTATWAGMATLGKTSAALIVIIGLILLCGWLLKRFSSQHTLQGQRLRVIASTAVGQRERVVIVEVGNTWLVLGVAAGQVSKLHELPVPPSPLPAASAAHASFASRLDHYLQKSTTTDRNSAGHTS